MITSQIHTTHQDLLHNATVSSVASFNIMRRTSLLLLFTFSITEAFLPSTLTHSLVHQANDKLSKKRSGVNHPTMAMSASDIVSVATLLPNIQDLVPPEVVSQPNWAAGIGREEAEALAGPFFGASLLPYLAFLYFLDVKENKTPKGITVGFATCLLFVFLTIPAAIGAQVWYGVSLADSDWLHGSAESLLTITNLVTVVAFRQALSAGESGLIGEGFSVDNGAVEKTIPPSITSYEPMIKLVIVSTTIAAITAIIPAVLGAGVHTPYLNGFMDLPKDLVTFGYSEPENALTIATWIIHISSLVEFLVAMGFACKFEYSSISLSSFILLTNSHRAMVRDFWKREMEGVDMGSNPSSLFWYYSMYLSFIFQPYSPHGSTSGLLDMCWKFHCSLCSLSNCVIQWLEISHCSVEFSLLSVKDYDGDSYRTTK